MTGCNPLHRRRPRLRAAITAAAVLAATIGATASPAGAMAPAEAWSETLDLLNLHTAGQGGPDGSVLLTGQLAESSDGERTGFVRRLDEDGAEEWRHEIGAPEVYDILLDVEVAGDGSSYVIGETRGDIAGTNAGGIDTVVRRLNASGITVWTDQIGTLQNDSGRAIAIGPDGSIYAAGSTSGELGIGSTGGIDAYIRKYSSTGAVLWTVQFGDTDSETVADIAVANDGTVWVVGNAAPVSGPGFTDGFITRIATSGGIISTEMTNDFFAGISFSKVYGVSAAPAGGVVIGGEAAFSTTATGFLRHYDDDGKATWTNRTDGHGLLAVYGVDVASTGEIYVAGYPSTGVFEEGALASFTSSGEFDWSIEQHSSNSTFVAATSDGGVLYHGANVLSSPGELVRYAASGGGGGSTFTDVPANAFYADAVEWLKAEGITTGTSPTTYSPDDTVTRGQMAAFLHRLVGTPSGSGAHGFSDVPSSAFYAAAVAWLKAEGITTGTSPTTYSPDDSVTRGQMAAFLHRLAGSPTGSPAHGFSDVPAGAFYSVAVAWLKAQGITTGTSATTYSPNDVVTRGQMAAFLFRMATDSDWDYPGD